MAVTLPPEEANLLLRFAERAYAEDLAALFPLMLGGEARPVPSRPRLRTIGRGLRRAAGELERLDLLVDVARADVDTIHYLDPGVDLGDETRRLRRLARALRLRGDRLDPRPIRHTFAVTGGAPPA